MWKRRSRTDKKQMIRIRGSKQQIIQQWQEEYTRICSENEINTEEFSELFSQLFDEMLDLSPSFSDEESFAVLNENYGQGAKLLTPNAEYFISISRSTWVIFCLLVRMKNNVIWDVGAKVFEELLKMAGIDYLDAPMIKKLESIFGHSCIILEAFKNRKDGIDQNILDRNGGECVHGDLECKYRDELGRCGCGSGNVEIIIDELEEMHLLQKKRGRYYYNDFC